MSNFRPMWIKFQSFFFFFFCMSTWNSKNQYCSQLKYWFPSLPLYVVKCYQTTFILSHKNAFICWPYLWFVSALLWQTSILLINQWHIQFAMLRYKSLKYVRIFRRKSDFSWWWYTCNSQCLEQVTSSAWQV